MNISQTSPTEYAITVTAADWPDQPDLFDDEPSVTYLVKPYRTDGQLLFDVNFADSAGYADSDIFDASDFVAQFGQPAFDTVAAAC